MRLIDADALMQNAEYKGKHDILTAYDVVAAPTIDAVPVVTCESCRYSEGEPISDGRLWCDYLKTYMRYCSEGDRREETAKCQNRR